MQRKYTRTIYACFIGYMVQAIVNNFAPLLFLTFESTYKISLSKITMLITVNFMIQLVIDFASAGLIDKIGYRASAILAHILAGGGLICLAVLPNLCYSPFMGLLISVVIYAMGGGLLEVLLSPMIEALPTNNKEKTMSMLHSFYCWGHVGVVLVSTVFFQVFGTEHWEILALLWAVVPILNILLFQKAPILPLIADEEACLTMRQLAGKPVFWIMMILMLCSGASEQSVSQWASTFAEQGLGISKMAGDLAGPTLFAFSMGIARVIYGKYGDRMNLYLGMLASSMVCILSYLLISLVPFTSINLLGCGLCGLSVGIMWPGAFSIASGIMKRGGTALFAFLALAGDLGCSGGPTLVGLLSEQWGNNLKMGILGSTIFPILLLAGIVIVIMVYQNKPGIIKEEDLEI